MHERPAASDELALSFTVTLSEDADGVLGRVEFTDRDGTPVSRAVRGATCDEVASSIALVTALAIDARAETEPAASAPVAAPAPASVPAPPSPSHDAAATPAERPVSTLLFTAGFGGGFQSFVGPTGGLSLDAFLGVSSGPGGGALRLSAWHSRASGSQAGREAVFRAWGGRFDACPLAFERSRVFATPCLAIDAGFLRAEGVQSASLPEPHEASLPWFAATLLGRAGVVLGGLLVLEAEGGLTLPLVRKRFGFSKPEPPASLYSVPPVGAGAAIHAGVRF